MGNFYNLGNTFSIEDDPDQIFVRFSKDHFYNIVFLNKSGSDNDVVINYGSRSDGVIKKRDTISNLPRYFRLKDFVANKDYLFVCASNKYFYYKPNKLEETFNQSAIAPDSTVLPFDACEFLTDSTVLLYCIYNFHPCDGYAGLHLSVLDLNTNKIVRSKRVAFSGIALSHLSANWLTVVGNNIYIINPLTAAVSVFNQKLEQIDKFEINDLFDKKELDSNYKYLQYVDATLKLEWKRIDNLKKLNVNDQEACRSDVYGKSFIYDVISKTRSKYSFIEFLKFTGKGSLSIVVSRPLYNDDYRDLYFFDPNSKTIKKSYKKWRTTPIIPPQKSTDFFITPLTSSKLNFPYFEENVVFFMSLVNPKDFRFDEDGDFEKRLYDYYNKNGYTPTIIKSHY